MNDNPMDEREEMARKILAEAPRMRTSDKFKFACHPGVKCFNACCRNVNIVLTPLDILRMSRRLQMTTSDFLARHTLVPFSGKQVLPFVFMKMSDNEEKTCAFVTPKGCSIYEDRPWPCRMYPVGEASPGEGTQDQAFYFLITEDHCHGRECDQEWTVEKWLSDQGVPEYNDIGELFKQVLLHPYLASTPLDPARMEMFYMASYDLDRFRKFVFGSKFLNRFRLEPDYVERLRSDDMELMRFAFRWLRFALFGELSVPLNEELLSEREREMLKNRINR